MINLILWLFSFFKNKISLFIVIIFIFISSICEFYFAYLIIELINNITGIISLKYVYSILARFLLTLLVFLSSKYFYKNKIIVLQENPVHDISLLTLENLRKKGILYFESTSTGELISLFTTGISAIRLFFGKILFELIESFFSLVVVSFFLWNISYIMVITIFVCYLPYFLVKNIFNKKINDTNKNKADIKMALYKNIYNILNGIIEIKSFVKEIFIVKHLEKYLNKYSENTLKLISIRYFRGMIYRLISSFGIIVTFIVAINLYSHHLVSIGGFSMSIIFSSRVIWILNGISYNLIEQSLYLDQINKLYEFNKNINDTETIIDEYPKENLITNTELHGNISFENVSFYYNKNDYVIKNLTLKINKGEHIAIVGKTGSGKSTLLKLIAGFYKPTYGEIKYDGISSKDIDLNLIKKSMSYVFQEVFILGISIKENIMFGLDSTEEEAIIAAKKAGAHEFIINLKDKYNTILEEKGKSLSGGQKQRLAIARALIRNRNILILDEATSALDSQTENIVKNLIDFEMKNTTVICVAHRISSIKNYDRILFFENGNILESGKYEELMNNKSKFYEFITGEYNDKY